jgi:acyl-CoA thioester hydrolase
MAGCVELPIKVKTYDIDFLGHVSNIVYLRWLEDLRLLMLERTLPLQRQIEAGLAPVLLHTDIHYRRPIRLSDSPVGRMWLSGMTAARLVLAAQIVVGGALAAEATQTGVLIDLKTGRPVRLPPEARQVFAALLESHHSPGNPG